MRTAIGVLGAGGHAKVVIRLLQELGYDIAAIFDDNQKLVGTNLYGIPVIGPIEQVRQSGISRGVIAVGHNGIRKEISQRVQLEWLTLIHPKAFVDKTALIGKGCVVFAGAVIQPDAVIGDHVIINTSASIDHDCRIEDYAHVAPGARLAGQVTVRQGAFLGTGVVARPAVQIGEWSTVGAGAVIVKDLESNVTAVGVPAIPTKQSKKERPANSNGSHSAVRPASKLQSAGETNTSGSPRSKRIFLSPPHMSASERELLLDAFDSNWVAPLGPHVDAFEREFAEKIGVAEAVALSSGTAALHLALMLLDVQPGDEILTSTLTFAATANAIRYVGANPVFLDSCPDSWNMDPELLAEDLEDCARRGRLPKAVIAVDVFGQCADYESIAKTCRFYEVPLIEDAAEALGATYRGRPAGSFGEMGCFSFNGNKIITTSGGGMLVTERAEWAKRARFLSSQARDPAPHYEHSVVGYNYRLSNLLAAVGRGQLRVLDDRVERRRQIFAYYQRQLGPLPGIQFMPELDGSQSTRWLTCILVDPDELGVTREEIRLALEEENIEARPVWKPMHAQSVYAHCRKRGGNVADRLFELGLCLPSGSSLTDAELARIVDIIRTLVGSRVSGSSDLSRTTLTPAGLPGR